MPPAPARTGSGNLSPDGAHGPISFSPYLYKDRNLVECFFNKIKHFRRFATRFDKHAANYLAFINLNCIRVWLRVNEAGSYRVDNQRVVAYSAVLIAIKVPVLCGY